LRGLSTPLRFLAYVAGALLVLLVAAGVGATAGVVFGGGPEWLTSGSWNANALANKTVFTHTATDANNPGDYTTYVSDPAIDGDPNAVVLIVPSTDRGNARGASYDHNIGVWYEGVNEKKWAIFNQDGAAMPAGITFEVIIPPASETFVHFAEIDNTEGSRTYLDNPLTNGEQDALLTVTQNWNPGGGRGVYNDHPIGVLYDADMKRWAIYNRGGAPIPDGAAFNIGVGRVPNP
jgi:hypothetical protein